MTPTLRPVTSLVLLTLAACSQAASPERPAVLEALSAQGVSVVAEFPAGQGLRGFAAVIGDQPLAAYVTEGGQLIVGTRLDADGERVDEARLQQLVAVPAAVQAWQQLQGSAWVADGDDGAAQVIYTFSDPNCPYCHRFWEAARPWVDAGKVQLRHVMVGIIGADSPFKAAAILEASDRSAALRQHELGFDRGGIDALPAISAHSRKQLEDHQQLMLGLGFSGTPGIVARNPDGSLRKINGMPRPEAMQALFGPL